jgi:hypothetical protein
MLTLTTLSELKMENWLATAINELAADQSLDPEDAKVVYKTYGTGQVVSFGDAEYAMYEDYDEAEAAAVEYVKDSLEEDPGMFNQDWLQYYYYMRDMDKRLWASDLADWVHDLDDEDALERAGMGEDEDADEAREKLHDESYDNYLQELNDDAVGYLTSEFGYTLKDLIDKGIIVIDEEKAAQEAVDSDGVGHFLGSYSGSAIEIENAAGNLIGAVAFRIN